MDKYKVLVKNNELNKYKVFVSYKMGEEKILCRKLSMDPNVNKDEYYKLIKEEGNNNNRQFILTDDLLIELILKYIIIDKYDLITVITEDLELNETLRRHIEEMKNDRAYLSLLISSLKTNQEYGISFVTFRKFDEEISFQQNGIITTNTVVNEELLNFLRDTYFYWFKGGNYSE